MWILNTGYSHYYFFLNLSVVSLLANITSSVFCILCVCASERIDFVQYVYFTFTIYDLINIPSCHKAISCPVCVKLMTQFAF